MGFGRFLIKTAVGFFNPIFGHFVDAGYKKVKTGKSYFSCLELSVKETLTEDLPFVRNLYRTGRYDGKIEGTIEQSERDEKKFRELHDNQEKERLAWKETDARKDKLIDELGEKLSD